MKKYCLDSILNLYKFRQRKYCNVSSNRFFPTPTSCHNDFAEHSLCVSDDICLWRSCFGHRAKKVYDGEPEIGQPFFWDLAVIYLQTSVPLKCILSKMFPPHLEIFLFLFFSSSTWTDLHGCSFSGAIICTILHGLLRNDWAEQVYLSCTVRFTFFLSSLLSVYSFILGCLSYSPIICKIAAGLPLMCGDLWGEDYCLLNTDHILV